MPEEMSEHQKEVLRIEQVSEENLATIDREHERILKLLEEEKTKNTLLEVKVKRKEEIIRMFQGKISQLWGIIRGKNDKINLLIDELMKHDERYKIYEKESLF